MQYAKLEMIRECESLLPDRYFLKDDWFPNFIIFRRTAESESIGGGENEWEGFVKQIKYHFSKEN